MTTAFVLSGGGSLGAVQAGMLRALYERGIVPDLLVGTSAGAVNAAFLAARPAEPETADALAGVWRRLRRAEVFPANPLKGFLGFVGERNAFVSNGGLRAILERNTPIRRLEEARIPLHVIAVEVKSGAERCLSRGDAIRAVLASAAIPAVFPPVEWEGELLCDGGVANNTPITRALELGADEIYVLPTGFACGLTEVPKSALGMGLHALTLLIQQRLLVEIAALEERARILVLPPPCPSSVTPADFSQADLLIRTALRDAREFLKRLPATGSRVAHAAQWAHRHL